MLTKEIIEYVYRAAFIDRWNEHIRPHGFTELDNQAHKLAIAWMIARYEEDRHKRKAGFARLLEAEIFELFKRIQLTDIKPYMKHEIEKKFGKSLDRWAYKQAISQLKGLPKPFKEDFRRYLEDKGFRKDEKEILDAAGFLSTRWEFEIIRNLNQGIHGTGKIAKEIEAKGEGCDKFAAAKEILDDGKLKGFNDIIGKLRFQKRWTTVPRIPETSVMGHLLVTAALAYFLTESPEFIEGNTACALFHDLPESLTRDIITPVKHAAAGLDEYIKEIEAGLVCKEILPLLPKSWHKEIRYYTEHEFSDRYIGKDGKAVIGTPEEASAKMPVQGEIVRLADSLAACYEIRLSEKYGIKSPQMKIAKRDFKKYYEGRKIYGKAYEQLFK